MYNARMKLFIIVVGIIAAINNLIGIIINGPSAVQKLTPVVASLGSSVNQLRVFVLERASYPVVRATLVLYVILVLLMLYFLRPTSHELPQLAHLDKTTILENRIPDKIIVLENGLRVPNAYLNPVDNSGPISETPLR